MSIIHNYLSLHNQYVNLNVLLRLKSLGLSSPSQTLNMAYVLLQTSIIIMILRPREKPNKTCSTIQHTIQHCNRNTLTTNLNRINKTTQPFNLPALPILYLQLTKQNTQLLIIIISNYLY